MQDQHFALGCDKKELSNSHYTAQVCEELVVINLEQREFCSSGRKTSKCSFNVSLSFSLFTVSSPAWCV